MTTEDILNNFTKLSFDEILYKKKHSMRSGFHIMGEKPLCLVPRQEYFEFLERMFNRNGLLHMAKHHNQKIEYMGFLLICSDIDEITFVVQI